MSYYQTLSITSLHTNTDPNATWRPSKKLSPMMITVVPPSVQPSLGHIALIVGVAIKQTMADYRLNSLLPKKQNPQTTKNVYRER